jgi:HK97 family phage portal protein
LGWLDRFKNNKNVTVSRYQMITDQGSGYYAWNGKLYQSDIVRSAIRPKAQAIGKIIGKHIRETIKPDGTKDIKVNPDAYMRFLLEEPNPYMTGQMLQEKLAVQLELNNNAFAYINRDENDYPMEIYPITSTYCEALQNSQGELFLKFVLQNGKTVTFRYRDIIHLRKDFNDNEIFGDSPAPALTPLMEIVNTTDQGIVKAIKNSNVIKWLLKFTQSLRPEDIKKQTKDFVDSYLNIESETVGAAATDAKAEAKQVEPKDYVPNASQMDKTTQRIYSFFNTNDKIVQGKYDEDEWISYYEASIEPVVVQLSGEYTRKLFSRRERGHGNKIIFESSNLTFASMQTKLNLVQYVDRGILNPNEVREILNMAPREGGDEYIRRLDTRPADE